MNIMGYWLLAVGAALMLFGLFGVQTYVDVSETGLISSLPVGGQTLDKVANIHGMHLQSLCVFSGLGSVIGGIVAIGFGGVESQLRALSTMIGEAELGRNPEQSSDTADFLSDIATSETRDSEAEIARLKEEQDKFGITKEGEYFLYSDFRYEKLEDAIAYAKRQPSSVSP
jgi:hypothetical protein